MSMACSDRRYLVLWMPFLSADRVRREAADAPASEKPMVFVEKVKGASRLARLDRLATGEGLRAGMTLADARARLPGLRVLPWDTEADARYLAHLAEICVAYTPTVAVDLPEGLALDITGCAHLFGGEMGMRERVRRALRCAGISALCDAIASTPDMARALARFGNGSPCRVEDERQAARALPVAALECAPDDALALRRAGLRTLADVADRPSILFTARFSQSFTNRLARVLGEEDRRLSPLRPPPIYVAEHRCAEPVASDAVILEIVAELARRVGNLLEEQGHGGCLFETTFFRSDGAVRRVTVGSGRPIRDPRAILALYQERVAAIADPLDPGFGFDVVRLHVVRAERFSEPQTTLDAREDGREHVSALLDRLSARFGRERVVRLHAVDTHVPELAQRDRPSVGQARAKAQTEKLPGWPEADPVCGMRRPLHLFQPPQPIEVIEDAAAFHDAGRVGYPRRFVWRRMAHDVVHGEGPERIAPVWWAASPSATLPAVTRDYYRVETKLGRRFWLFRALDRDEAQPREQARIDADGGVPSRWFLHGVFA